MCVCVCVCVCLCLCGIERVRHHNVLVDVGLKVLNPKTSLSLQFTARQYAEVLMTVLILQSTQSVFVG